MSPHPYRGFAIMLTVSFFVMYAVMFLNVDQFDHVYLSLTRTYMSLLMVAAMALVMLSLMRHMYPNQRLNRLIAGGSVLVFALVLTLLRAQIPVGDVQYLKAMIPHHSSAILVSRSAEFKDPEVKKLSEGIIQSQEREIAEMKAAIARLESQQ
ncbi:DUF305 domain-containing protein [Hymenobacter lutimineralis]|uniref:DUF305 domain-containing protein n=2 Tax=Hymenobacter lutimineralis TaxID=2606448 RepID=A0A5D6USY7_9BACT|nr:DUF305 domain-containing protein [Hymenobacter lutimineralis]